MKIVSVVGARPQFIKLFPISRAIPEGIEHETIHTGQHYDESMSQIFFDELEIPRPVLNLQVGSGSHAQQTASMMVGLENGFLESRPDVVLVYGDTNSTIAAALVASKMHIPLAHLEAGLRSFNRKMPEELNRIATDHLSDLLLAPTKSAHNQLLLEGLGKSSHYVGDVMVDALYLGKEMISHLKQFEEITVSPFIFCTIHRAENVDDELRIRFILKRLAQSELHVVLAGHPRLLSRLRELKIELADFGIELIGSQSYLRTIDMLTKCTGVITDSGGIQRESYLLGKPTLIVRSETEWPEILIDNFCCLDPNMEKLNFFPRDSQTLDYDHDRLGFGDASVKAINLIIEKIF
jgi:UDP-N-acetylglucosamine 2-epimerase (non-hydrolysing)